jgi:hypothetical protein
MRKFQFVVAMRGGAVGVRIVEVRTEQRAKELAERILRESTQNLSVDVWEGERHLFAVGQARHSAA